MSFDRFSADSSGWLVDFGAVFGWCLGVLGGFWRISVRFRWIWVEGSGGCLWRFGSCLAVLFRRVEWVFGGFFADFGWCLAVMAPPERNIHITNFENVLTRANFNLSLSRRLGTPSRKNH